MNCLCCGCETVKQSQTVDGLLFCHKCYRFSYLPSPKKHKKNHTPADILKAIREIAFPDSMYNASAIGIIGDICKIDPRILQLMSLIAESEYPLQGKIEALTEEIDIYRIVDDIAGLYLTDSLSTEYVVRCYAVAAERNVKYIDIQKRKKEEAALKAKEKKEQEAKERREHREREKEKKLQEEKALRVQRDKEREKRLQEEKTLREQREKEREKRIQEEKARREQREREKAALKKRRKQKIKKDFLSIFKAAIVTLFIVECIIFAVSLITIFIGWINGTGHAPIWTCLLWESLAFGLPSGIYISEAL